MDYMEYDPKDPNYWLKLPPDYAIRVLASEFGTFRMHIRATYFFLKMNNSLKGIILDNGESITEFIEEQEKRLEFIDQILNATSHWVDAYREGKIVLKNTSSINDDSA
jgi:hypothetical protein